MILDFSNLFPASMHQIMELYSFKNTFKKGICLCFRANLQEKEKITDLQKNYFMGYFIS